MVSEAGLLLHDDKAARARLTGGPPGSCSGLAFTLRAYSNDTLTNDVRVI